LLFSNLFVFPTLIDRSASNVVKGKGSVNIIDVVEEMEELQVVVPADAFFTFLKPENIK